MANRRRATLADVARKAGVGIATVDRVLNARAPVSKETAARVMSAAEALDYHARGLMRQRLRDLVPSKRLGFVLQKQSKWFYQELARAIQNAARAQPDIRAEVEIGFVESLSPNDLSQEITRMAGRCDAVAAVSIDHPKVNEAIAAASEGGVPVFALLSRLTAPELAGFSGIDGNKAGRTAGWSMARLAGVADEVGILVGSYRYLGHEALEAGFRSAMREYAPEVRLRESIVYLDDRAVAYEAASELLANAPGLGGIYHIGGGVSGVVTALAESGRGRELTYICQEQSPATRQALIDGIADIVIATPIADVAGAAVDAMARHLCSVTPPAPDYAIAEFRLMTPESV